MTDFRTDWKRITDPGDPQYDAGNPRYSAQWYGSEPPPEIGPSGQSDGRLDWALTLDEAAPVAAHRSGKRWLAQRLSPPLPEAPELDGR
jgi:hypothetical protein